MVTATSNSSDRPIIELKEISRSFGTTRAVDKVSFNVGKGEVFGFIGPNGAGKTTSMRILATLDLPDEGDAFIDGFSVIDDPDRVRKRMGWMPDGFGTYPNVNCEEYLDFFARAYGMRGTERRSALRNVMGFTQLDQLARKPITGLSKGMKQRLCLGRTLIHDPSVLIMDEPAAGLDPRARIELREMIAALSDQGKSILISSHILTELAEMCDRVAIIEQGGLLAVGSVEEILNKEGHSSGTSQAGTQVVLVTQILSDLETAMSWLKQREGVSNLQSRNNTLEFEFVLNDAQQAELLSEMIAANIQVVSFSRRQKSLEDAFLHVTKGIVQ